MSKQARAKENKNPNPNLECDKRICLCVCCVPNGWTAKHRLACTCGCNKCKCTRNRFKDKPAVISAPKVQPSPCVFVQEDPSQLPTKSPKRNTANSKCTSHRFSNNPVLAEAQERESMMNCFEYEAGDPSPTHTNLKSPPVESMEDKIGMRYYYNTTKLTSNTIKLTTNTTNLTVYTTNLTTHTTKLYR